MTKTNINRSAFLTISILTICIGILLTFLNLREFYVVGILKQTQEYSFGCEGTTAYYYKTAGLYSIVTLIWGLIYLTTLTFALKATIKGERKKGLIVSVVILFLLLTEFLHGQIGA